MNPFYCKSKKIFTAFLVIILFISSISYVSAAYDRDNLKLGVKLKFTGTSLVIYKSRTDALLQNKEDISYLKKNEEITVKGILR